MTVECDLCGREFASERGVKVHQTATHDAEKAYTDEEKLRELYWGESLSMGQVAERLDTDKDRVAYWMGVHGVETRRAYSEQNYASLRVEEGYTLWREYYDGEYNRVPVHRLLAVAEYGYDAVVGKDVHHKNGIRFDNRPSNIEPVDPSEHRRIHGEERADEQRELISQLREDGRLEGGVS